MKKETHIAGGHDFYPLDVILEDDTITIQQEKSDRQGTHWQAEIQINEQMLLDLCEAIVKLRMQE